MDDGQCLYPERNPYGETRIGEPKRVRMSAGTRRPRSARMASATVVNELTFDSFWIDLSLVRMFELMGGMLVRVGDEGC